MSTKAITFGGKEADIGIPLKDFFVVESKAKKSCTFEISPVNEKTKKDMKHKLKVQPTKFVLERGEKRVVSIDIKIFCTTTVSDQIEVKATRTKKTAK